MGSIFQVQSCGIAMIRFLKTHLSRPGATLLLGPKVSLSFLVSISANTEGDNPEELSNDAPCRVESCRLCAFSCNLELYCSCPHLQETRGTIFSFPLLPALVYIRLLDTLLLL